MKKDAKTQKRALLVNDLSAVGRCSLTVALPVVSCFGVEAAALPTAVLSTHTGGFTGYTRRDLSDDIPSVAAHWRSLGLSFDGIYTGYLASEAQIGLIENLVRDFPCPLLLVDPVMADDGRFYAGFGENYLARMRKFVRRADVLLPNLTEASLLTGTPYRPQADEADARALADKLLALGPRSVVIKGVAAPGGEIGILAADASERAFFTTPREPGFYHGAGDVFASVLFAAHLSGEPLAEAARRAASFTYDCVAATRAVGTDTRYGLIYEPLLGKLTK